MRYLIISTGGHPLAEFTDLLEAERFIEDTNHVILYVYPAGFRPWKP